MVGLLLCGRWVDLLLRLTHPTFILVVYSHTVMT